MSTNKIIEGDIAGAVANYALVVSRFNSYIVDSLEAGAIDALQRHGVTDANITVVKVPGALEVPLTVKKLIDKGSFDAIIALGAVIRGSTYHFEIVSNESARGLAELSLEQQIPIINGILTVDTIEQALERAGTKAGNKGADAALAALEMVSLMRRLASGS